MGIAARRRRRAGVGVFLHGGVSSVCSGGFGVCAMSRLIVMHNIGFDGVEIMAILMAITAREENYEIR